VEATEVSRADREELFAARKLSGDVPLLAALKEWRKAANLTQGQVITAAEAWKARNRGEIDRATVGEALTRFLRDKKKLGYHTAANHGSILKAVRGALGDYQIAQVSASMIDGYLGKIAHPVTRNTHRKRVVTLWRWAQSKNLLPRDAKTEADQTSRSREQAPEVGIISAETYGKLLERVRVKEPADLAALVLAGFCGLRRGEIHGQHWDDVKLDVKHVRVTTAKKGTPARRLVPLSDAAVEWLMLCPKRKGAVCDGMAMDRVRKLGVEAEFVLPENCFRHSYISHHVAAIGNVPQAALDSGNSVQIIHRHYRELVTPAEGAEWFAIKPEAAS
jgi:integrase